MFAKYIKDRFPRRGCGHILGLFKQLIQDYVCTPPSLQKFQKIQKPYFTYIFSYATKQRTSSCLSANCLHSISHFNSLPQLLTKSLFKLPGSFEANTILQLFKPANNIGSEAVIAAGPGIDIFPKRSGSVCHIAEKSDNVFKSFLLKACPH